MSDYEIIGKDGVQALLVSSAEPYFFQLVGPLTAIEAMYAHLTSTGVRRNGWTGYGFRIQPGVQYQRRSRQMTNQMTEMIIFHPALLANWAEGNFIIVTDVEGMPDAFFSRLSLNLTLPILDEWADALWQEGQHVDSGLPPITQVNTVGGVYAWKIMTKDKYLPIWHTIIKNILGVKEVAAHGAG